jgi:transposase
MERLFMHRVREILRLRWVLKLGVRQAASAAGVGRSVVSKTSNRAERAGLSWEAVEALSDAALEARLYGTPQPSAASRAEPDPIYIHTELRRPGVTLELLHLEYLQAHPDGYRYTAYCDRYRAWQKKRGVWMRQVHRAGEKSFVDYSGKRPFLIDRDTGERVYVELFVGVLGASSYTFAEATQTQRIADFVGSHVRMFEFFGGVSLMVVPDQLKSAVTVASRVEPQIARTYSDFGQHYGTAIVPARPRKPRDKAKVEVAVQVAQRWILARLRNETFFTLRALNERMRELLDELNSRPMKRLGGKTRRELYEALDKPALLPLPTEAFECSEWLRPTVHGDHHVEVERHYYSVPYQLVHEIMDVRLTAATLEVFHRGVRVTALARSYVAYDSTTKPEHRPPNHRAWAQADSTSVIAWAQSIGPITAAYVQKLIELRPTGLRSALGLRRVAKPHDRARIEEACECALRLGSTSYKPVERMLRLGPQQRERAARNQGIGHANVRGPKYFQ